MDDRDAARHAYAETVCATANVCLPALRAAFACVARERFLGPGPWQVMRSLPTPGEGINETTADADPRHLYADILVAIDPARYLNNGQPSALARWIDALDLCTGDRVLHVGCGVGYYTAILAEVVGPLGHITAIDIDADLAQRARTHLAPWPQVEVVTGDGGQLDTGPCDAIFVNAGATHPRPLWLERLRPRGRLLVPLTVNIDGAPFAGVGWGGMLKIATSGDAFAAQWVSPVGIFHCADARDPGVERRLREAFERGGWEAVRSLRVMSHAAGETCWLHAPGFCLSTLPPPAA